MKKLFQVIITIALIASLMMNLGVIVYINGYFKFVGTNLDITQTVHGDDKGSGQFKGNAIEKTLRKSYEALSKKLGGKYYFDNSSKNKLIIKKIYYLDGQIVKAKVTFIDGTTKTYNKVKFDSIVAKKQYIKNVEVFVINGKPLAGTIIFQGNELGTSVDEKISILE